MCFLIPDAQEIIKRHCSFTQIYHKTCCVFLLDGAKVVQMHSLYPSCYQAVIYSNFIANLLLLSQVKEIV